jgi:hypothetical protein
MNLLILVVDDEPDVEMLFRQQFRRDLRDARPFSPMCRLYVEPLLCCCVNPSAKDSPTRKNKGVCALTI